MSHYLPEPFNENERKVIQSYFSNDDQAVFTLTNLSQEVKAALFARYSRTSKSLRRVFLDEFADLDQNATAPTTGSTRARSLMERVIGDYGDDSVAQLAVVHIAVEQLSQVVAREIENHRLMSFLEQSSRYVDLGDRRADGSLRYAVPTELTGKVAEKYHRHMETTFALYRQLTRIAEQNLAPEAPSSDPAARRAIKAAALDAARSVLPLATLTNIGIVGNAQSLEYLVTKLRITPLNEANQIAEQIAAELRVQLPSLTSRMDRPDRGGVHRNYLASTRAKTFEIASKYRSSLVETTEDKPLTLLRHDADAEQMIAAAILFEGGIAYDNAISLANQLSSDQIDALFNVYVGDRQNRRHKPGRAFEAARYSFAIELDYGAFRDLARHRPLTLLTSELVPPYRLFPDPATQSAGIWPDAERHGEAALEFASELYETFGPLVARYVLPMATRIQFAWEVNARELMHIIELRSSPQGHPSYRKVAQMLINELRRVGHTRIAEAMAFVDFSEPKIGRLEAERRVDAERRRK